MRPKRGNELSKVGNSLHLAVRAPISTYEGAIAEALRRELPGSHKAVKTMMRWTGASARTAKNWFTGAAGPSGPHLISLMKNSDAVLQAVLLLAARGPQSRDSGTVAAACMLLKEALQLFEV